MEIYEEKIIVKKLNIYERAPVTSLLLNDIFCIIKFIKSKSRDNNYVVKRATARERL